MSSGGGRCTTPPYTGQRPPRIRKREDFPHPLGPMMRRCMPGLTSNVSSGTRTSPLGETMGTLSNLMKSEGVTAPRDWRMLGSWWADFACVGTVEEETRFFSKCPARMSDITFRRALTREVYPASSVISLYENMRRPKASEEERRRRRLVTKSSVVV